ncbi:type VI secretion system baseplate subunit TssF [Limnoglobus roseus]|uniref:Type VI secretion system baseplate subunit TssF n=1 Tax=Limnoglobus roseus TaxID=2598579 RepID=A0A5C1AKM2_9BACT|nr:type VI secretion system baseplate subunit TssF [Limnoglobus roseus]QEL19460.1 type VI secretion system baseplate subunit TssF [Limnoglobus roseus]
MSLLFPYYERELAFLRQMAAEFARSHPAAAGRLLLEPNRSADPHVERLLESFALLTARVHHKLDDEFPELADGLLSVLYPHYLAPMPSCAIVQFDVDAGRGPLPNGFVIPRHSRIVTQPVKDTVCRYQTCYPTTLWPIKVTQARLVSPPFPPGLTPPPRTASALILRFETLTGEPFSQFALDRLRVHLNGPPFVTGGLYELLFGQALQVLVRTADPKATATSVRLDPAKVIRPVGFEADEGLIPYPPPSFLGYRLLTEFFAFPAKFAFADLVGLTASRAVANSRAIEVVVFLDRAVPSLEAAVEAGTFRLGCTPVVNLFEQTAEPIPLTRTKHQYRVVPDVARPLGCEVFSIDSVTATDVGTGTRTEYRPFYSVRHSPDGPQAYWYSSRTTAEGDDRGTDVDLVLVDLDFRPLKPDDTTLVVRTTCTNRDLPARLQRFGDAMTLGLEGAAPVSGVRAIRSPTLPLRPPPRRGRFWRLVSHLNLNHLSLTDPAEGGESLREILRLYDAADPATDPQQAAAVRQLIDGVSGVACRRVPGRTPGAGGGFVRGVEIAVEFDPQKFIDTGGSYLFAAVLERFFGLYASINSFTQMVAKTRHGEGVQRKWPPRAGEQVLI